MAHLSDGGEYGGSKWHTCKIEVGEYGRSKWHTCQVEASMDAQSGTLVS